MRQAIHNHCSLCICQEAVTQANQCSGRNGIRHPRCTAGGLLLFAELRFALAKLLADNTDKLRTNLNQQFFNWLLLTAIFGDRHNFWPSNLKFVAFAAHRLDQYTVVKLTSARHYKANTRLSHS